jgi:hypothetical protein
MKEIHWIPYGGKEGKKAVNCPRSLSPRVQEIEGSNKIIIFKMFCRLFFSSQLPFHSPQSYLNPFNLFHPKDHQSNHGESPSVTKTTQAVNSPKIKKYLEKTQSLPLVITQS